MAAALRRQVRSLPNYRIGARPALVMASRRMRLPFSRLLLLLPPTVVRGFTSCSGGGRVDLASSACYVSGAAHSCQHSPTYFGYTDRKWDDVPVLQRPDVCAHTTIAPGTSFTMGNTILSYSVYYAESQPAMSHLVTQTGWATSFHPPTLPPDTFLPTGGASVMFRILGVGNETVTAPGCAPHLQQLQQWSGHLRVDGGHLPSRHGAAGLRLRHCDRALLRGPPGDGATHLAALVRQSHGAREGHPPRGQELLRLAPVWRHD